MRSFDDQDSPRDPAQALRRRAALAYIARAVRTGSDPAPEHFVGRILDGLESEDVLRQIMSEEESRHGRAESDRGD